MKAGEAPRRAVPDKEAAEAVAWRQAQGLSSGLWAVKEMQARSRYHAILATTSRFHDPAAQAQLALAWAMLSSAPTLVEDPPAEAAENLPAAVLPEETNP